MNDLTDPPSLRERLEALAINSSCFLIIYSATNRISALRSDIGVAVFSWEHLIPFVPWLIFPYWTLDLFFVAAPFVCKTREQLRNLVFQLCFAIFIAGLFFVAFPLKLLFQRPPVTGAAGFLFGSLDNMKDFFNLAPSLHIAIRSILWALYIPLVSGRTRRLFRFWFILIGVSTLLCWRHHVIDVYTGHLLALVTLHIFSERISITDVSISKKQNANTKLALFYLLGAFVVVVISGLAVPATLLLLWPACALAIVGIAYIGFGPRFLGKTEEGYKPWTLSLLYPYLLGARLSARIQGRKLPEAAEITPRLRLGKLLTESQARSQIQSGVTAVLDLTAELPETKSFRGIHYRNIPILDLTAPSPEQLHEAVSFIKEEEKTGVVYVHCALGRSRSTVIAAGYLIAESGLSPVEALEKLRIANPHAVLKPEYLATLEEFSEQLKSARKRPPDKKKKGS